MPKKMWHNLLKGAGTTGYEISGESTATTFHIRGTSTNVGGTETFNIRFINDGALTPSTEETITCAVDAQGNWGYEYSGKKIYSLSGFAYQKTTILSVDFSDSDDGKEIISLSSHWTSGLYTGAFCQCTNLTSVNFSNFSFEKLQNVEMLFYGCSALTTINWSQNLNLDNLNKLSGSGGAGIFQGCSLLNNASVNGFISGQSFPNVTEASNMFNGCTSLTSIDLSSATFPLLSNFSSAFAGCTNLITVNISKITFSNATALQALFFNCSSLTTINWSQNLNLDKVTTMSMFQGSGRYAGMFRGCSSLMTMTAFANQTFPALSGNNSIAEMFQGCSSLTTIDMRSGTFANCTISNSMFQGCSSLTTLNLSNATFENITSGTSMFQGCSSLTTLNLSNATFENITNIGSMFNDCTSLTSIDLSSATFASITDCRNMFYNCQALTSVDLHLVTFNDAINCSYMFYNCLALVNVDLGGAIMSKIQDNRSMFEKNNALTTINVPQNSTAFGYAGISNTVHLNLNQSGNLGYTSMFKVSNWVADLTGTYRPIGTKTQAQFNARTENWYTYDSVNDVYILVQPNDPWIQGEVYYISNVHSMTFKTSAWNALTSAEQNNIDSILTAKNWTRVLA